MQTAKVEILLPRLRLLLLCRRCLQLVVNDDVRNCQWRHSHGSRCSLRDRSQHAGLPQLGIRTGGRLTMSLYHDCRSALTEHYAATAPARCFTHTSYSMITLAAPPTKNSTSHKTRLSAQKRAQHENVYPSSHDLYTSTATKRPVPPKNMYLAQSPRRSEQQDAGRKKQQHDGDEDEYEYEYEYEYEDEDEDKNGSENEGGQGWPRTSGRKSALTQHTEATT